MREIIRVALLRKIEGRSLASVSVLGKKRTLSRRRCG
jgi:hypothetical protein